MQLDIQERDRRYRVDCQRDGDFHRFTLEDEEGKRCRIEAQDATTILLRLDGRLVRARYARKDQDLWVQIGAVISRFRIVEEGDEDEAVAGGGSPVVRAPMPGKVLAVLVEEGQSVELGQPVIRVEAMKMEVELPAQVAGTVETIHAAAGEMVDPEAPLVTLTPAEPSE